MSNYGGLTLLLFEPFSFSGLFLNNRIVRAATYEKRADEDGRVTDALIEFYEKAARGGPGLIITGNALVHPSGRTAPRMLSMHADSYIDGLRRLSDAVHALGGVIAVQIVHGGRQCPPMLLGGDEPMAPSAVYDPSTKITPREMKDSEIWDIIDAFGEAARRAKSAGFDAIELHGAHGYLISGFLSPHTNRRDDYWGGDEERRFHFSEETYKAVRSEAGKEFPVLMKINCDDLVPGGMKPDESLRVVQKLESMGLDAVEISGGMRESSIKTVRPHIYKPEEEAYFRESGRLFKRNLRIPVILTGGMRSASVMEDVLSSGDADLIGICRPLIREPQLPNLLREGKAKAQCVSCNGCLRFEKLDFVKCAQKPAN